MTASNENWPYRAGVGVAALTSFLIVWTTIVRDDGSGMAWFNLILAAAVGAFAAGFRPAGVARAMLGVAAMQILLGVATATAPIVANTPDGSLRAVLFSGAFTGLWLAAANFFRMASRRERQTVVAQ